MTFGDFVRTTVDNFRRFFAAPFAGGEGSGAGGGDGGNAGERKTQACGTGDRMTDSDLPPFLRQQDRTDSDLDAAAQASQPESSTGESTMNSGDRHGHQDDLTPAAAGADVTLPATAGPAGVEEESENPIQAGDTGDSPGAGQVPAVGSSTEETVTPQARPPSDEPLSHEPEESVPPPAAEAGAPIASAADVSAEDTSGGETDASVDGEPDTAASVTRDTIVQGELDLPDETIPPEVQVAVRGTLLPLTAVLESLLFVADEPVEAGQLAKALEISPNVVAAGLERLELLYRREGRGLRLLELDDRLQLVTLPAAAGAIEDFLNLDLTTRLSGPALETLAVIAYRQPVTRAQVESVRGVDCSGVLRSLLQRGLIEEAGRLETVGRPILYGVTDLFMQHFGLTGLDELPELDLEDADTLWAATELLDDPAALDTETAAQLAAMRDRAVEALADDADVSAGDDNAAVVEGDADRDVGVRPADEPHVDAAAEDAGDTAGPAGAMTDAAANDAPPDSRGEAGV